MKTIMFAALFLTLILTGCQKPKTEQTQSPDQTLAINQFTKSDENISAYLDKLDSAETPQEEQIRILCKDYPAEYKNNYVPALLKLQSNDYTKAQLFKDLDMALNYYKEKLSITC